ncbi:MAG TPA: flagellar biosynthesis protein FliQ [Alphaproteobacteria bacterium]|nr:flagellar biosynthetic protein FliQ [Rhodospirillaceae bacterium]HRJ12695.1 flagellar biosynthesis protein FliQ [Alphaproteobacteria bacterium]
MTAPEVVDILREGIWVMIMIMAAPVLAGLVIGVAVSLFQALTQIQEMTLTFVPKLLVIFTIIVLTLPFMLFELKKYTLSLADKIATLG